MFNTLPIELQAILRFQSVVKLRYCVLEGNHRCTTSLRHMFDFSFETFGPGKTDVFALNQLLFNRNSSKLEDLITFELNFELYTKPEEVDNEEYRKRCQEKSLVLQTNAGMVVRHEKAHK